MRTGPFCANPLLLSEGSADFARIKPHHDGIAGDLLRSGEAPHDEADLIIGLDFGTSSTKAVIRDHQANVVYAVPFTKSPDNPYLLASRVWRTGDAYSLDAGERAERDLKLGLLGCGVPYPLNEFNDACAFLALVIRHCRGWLLSAHKKMYARKRLNWSLNLGLPARSYEDDIIVTLFRRLSWAAFSLASRAEAVTAGAVDRVRMRSREVFASRVRPQKNETELDSVDVVPEIAAQIYGFVVGSGWDWRHRPMLMLIDIGAGTVDAAFFSFTRLVRNEPRVAFFGNEVLPNGVMNLHRERTAWLRQAAVAGGVDDPALLEFLESVRFPTDRLSQIPESVRDYIGGYEIQPAAVRDVDELFYQSRYRTQVGACIRAARLKGKVPIAQMQNVPCFLTGGGSRMNLYSRIIADIPKLNTITVESMRLTIPYQGFECPALRETDMDRLSVAYGLGHHGAGGKALGKIIRAIDMSSSNDALGVANWRSNYVDKDMC